DRGERDLVARLELERLEEEVEPGANREADEAFVAPVPGVEDARARAGSRTEARAECEEQVAQRHVEDEPRPEPPRQAHELRLQTRHGGPEARRRLARRRTRILREPIECHRPPERDPPPPEARQ